MIIEFKSKAAAGFFMTEPVMRLVFTAIGHEFAPSGIFTAEQVPAVRSKLAHAIEQSRLQDRASIAQHDESSLAGESNAQDLQVGLSQRAFPLLEMLAAAEKQKVPVVWGV
ncbi:MAG: DUF1840 family protein [Verrucomicrobia bacterium]|nr:DUF1840 family protein [Verrucomicrobiota bacterium]